VHKSALFDKRFLTIGANCVNDFVKMPGGEGMPELFQCELFEIGEYAVAHWRRRPAGANFQSLPRIPATPRTKFAEAGRLGQHPGRVRSPEAGALQVLAQQSTPRLSLCGGGFRLRSNG